MRDLSNTISFEYKSPLKAIKYLKGLYVEIMKLSSHAESYMLQKHMPIIKYGFNTRRLNYKKMAIIYSVIDNSVYIQRVIPFSAITGL